MSGNKMVYGCNIIIPILVQILFPIDVPYILISSFDLLYCHRLGIIIMINGATE